MSVTSNGDLGLKNPPKITQQFNPLEVVKKNHINLAYRLSNVIAVHCFKGVLPQSLGHTF